MDDRAKRKAKNLGGNPSWVPGVSPNPTGRPKGSGIITKEMIKWAEQNGHAKALAKKIGDLALKGNMKAAEMIANRVDGLPVARVITSEDKSGEFFGLMNTVLADGANGSDDEGKDKKGV